MPRFLNDDVKLKNGGRKAVRITKEELGEKILSRAMAVDYDGMLGCMSPNDPWYDDMMGDDVIGVLVRNDTVLASDDKFSLFGECSHAVTDANWNPDLTNTVIGMHTLENGFTFYGFFAGEDEGGDAICIIYFDGKKLRMYTPTAGNSVNLDYKCAMNSEELHGNNVNENAMFTKYQKLGLCRNLSEFQALNKSCLYAFKYNLPLPWDYCASAILQDITSRIELIP